MMGPGGVLVLMGLLSLGRAVPFGKARQGAVGAPGAGKVPISVNHAYFRSGTGAKLYALYCLPATPGPLQIPTTVHFTPYPMEFVQDGNVGGWQNSLSWANYSALVLIQLTGTGNSTGKFNGFNPASEDSKAGMEWIAGQPWSNKVINVVGFSAMGIDAYLTYKHNNLGHNYFYRTAFIGIGTSNLYKDLYPGGAFRFSMAHDLAFPLNESSYISVLEAHESPQDPYWESTTLNTEEFKEVRNPTVQSPGWLDIFLNGQLEAWEGFSTHSDLRVRGLHRLIVPPFGHCDGGNIPWNKSAVEAQEITFFLLEQATNALFNHTNTPVKFDLALGEYELLLLKYKVPRFIWYIAGTGVPNNDGLGHYLAAGNVKPKMTPLVLYLDNANQTLTMSPPVSEMRDGYVYNPKDPYPTIGGNNFDPSTFNNPVIPPIPPPKPPKCGPWDQNLVGARSDVLKFTGPVLGKPVVGFGENKVELFVSSNCTDTDFVVILVDIFPNGTRLLVQEAQQRMRWRNMGRNPDPMVPGDIYKVTISLSQIAWIFRAGHRIGLHVTSSSWPRISINPNTGAPLSTGGGINAPHKLALNSVHAGGSSPSALILSVAELSDLPVWYPTPPHFDMLEHAHQAAARVAAATE